MSSIAEKKGGAAPQTAQDIRKVLEDKNIDAVSIATPNHWHCLMTIWACQAGKDVYCEKPLSHTVHEGRVAVDAARKYDRIVQHGTQRRSSKTWAQIAAAVKTGQFGQLVVSRGLSTGDYYGNKVGNTLHFADGTTIAEGGKLYRKGSDKPEKLPSLQGEVAEQYEGNHFRNFVDCVRSRKREELHADVLEGHLSSVPCHLSNISYRLGEQVPFNAKTKALGDDAVALETFARLEEHLGQGNGLKLDDMQYRLGKTLTFDAATEKFTNSDEANALLTRAPRAGFTVPEKLV